MGTQAAERRQEISHRLAKRARGWRPTHQGALLRNSREYLGCKWNGTRGGLGGFHKTITHRFNAFNKVSLLSLLVFFLGF